MTTRKQIRQRDRRTGRVYVYETDFEYDKTTKKTLLRNRRLVGHIDEDTGEVVPNRPRTKPTPPVRFPRRLFTGATGLLDHACQVTGLTDDLKQTLPDQWDKILSLAYYLICEDRSPISRFARWGLSHAHPYGHTITSQRASDLLASIDHADKERFCRLQARRRSETEWWVYDTTSISTWSEQLTQARWGHNKDHQPIPQINLALLFGETTGLPFHYRTLPGNIPDVTTISHLIAAMPFLDSAKPRLACDRGFYSKKNIDDLIGAHIKFLIGAPARLKLVKTAITDHDDELRAWTNWDENREVHALKIPITWKWQHHHPRTGQTERADRRAYLHLYHSPALAAQDERALAALLKTLHRELETGNRIEAHRSLYDHYFTTRRGHPTGRDDRIQAARDRYGHFALLTNDAQLTPIQAIDIYRRKDAVEKAFAAVKTQLDFRTPRIHNDQTLQGKLFLVYIALTITSWLHKQMTDSGLFDDWTMTGLLDELDTIEQHHEQHHKPRTLETTIKQRTIYEKLGLTPPNAS